VRPVIWPLRALTAAAAILVTIAGTQLFALATETDRYFAWTIKPAITAAFLGASYWASLFILLDVTFGTAWLRARAGLYSVLTFTTLTLVATLMHLDRFHFNEADPIPVVAAWAWMVVYVAVPPLLALAVILQLRTPGFDPAKSAPLPGWLRVFFAIQAVITLLVGLSLFLAPASAAWLWPWPLTPLTSRAIAAWLIAFAVAGFGVAAENDRPSTFGPAQSYTALGVLQLLAIWRFSGDIDWQHAAALPYVAFWAIVLVFGAYSAALARRAFDGPGQRD
jgi:hypothetical protein